jgi:hypothetical protein
MGVLKRLRKKFKGAVVRTLLGRYMVGTSPKCECGGDLSLQYMAGGPEGTVAGLSCGKCGGAFEERVASSYQPLKQRL